MTDFLNIEYLKSGNEKQQKVYKTLKLNAVLEKLSQFTPVLVGTIPINIDILSSDLDIACFWKDKNHFIEIVKNSFGGQKEFQISETAIYNETTIIATFLLDDFEIEIFGQNIPVSQQNGFRHMIIENKILEEQGEEFRQKIIELKKQGYKTEPAFALLLGLKGNSYDELLKLA